MPTWADTCCSRRRAGLCVRAMCTSARPESQLGAHDSPQAVVPADLRRVTGSSPPIRGHGNYS
jgi:hypothetical protein